MRYILKLMVFLLTLVLYGQAMGQSVDPKFIDVFIDSGDKAALLDSYQSSRRNE